MPIQLEHANITVADAKATAQQLCQLFDWTVRWEGASLDDGYSVHVGSKDSYLALYSPKGVTTGQATRYVHAAGLNHVGLIVDDLDAMEARVKAAGYEPHSHADYEPGRRFYFDGPGGVEYELVRYD
ncbi:VOC family protein [Tropicibacter oceani]|uniref:VOC family protein n=1 Tax=Tropicibacter oceani TaxID=3058420 RepID=A0ABY8QF32_9RHOB|nr:VOC family protein [Tropicibacter oceani]WGW03230.1 VOC family protein [Tropicibacter oceani]